MNDITKPQQQHTMLTATHTHTLKNENGNRLTVAQKSMISYTTASLCFLSELIHLWLLPEEYETFIIYGIIFLLIAMAQGIIGTNLLFEPRRRLLTCGVWVNALIVVLYGFTHTIGVVVGLGFLLLPVDSWGVIATVVEIGAIILLLFLRFNIPHTRQ